MTMLESPPHCTDGLSLRPNSFCRSFDFTPGFENIVLSILPNALLIILWSALRFPHLSRRKEIVSLAWKADALLLIRTAVAGLTCCLALALLIVVATLPSSLTYSQVGGSTFLAACIISLASSLLYTFAT